MTNLQYKWLLRYLEDMTDTLRITEFDSREVSDFIRMRVFLKTENVDAASRNTFSVKYISNDLNRLYRMRLLKRKRIKRLCNVKKLFDDEERIFMRGFMFKYSFAKQGLSYTKYLKKSSTVLKHAAKQESDLLKDIDFISATRHVQNQIPELGIAAWKGALYFRTFIGTNIEFKGRYRRFPPKIDRLLMYLVIKIIRECREKNERNQQLQQEIQRIQEERIKEREWYTEQVRQLADKTKQLSAGKG